MHSYKNFKKDVFITLFFLTPWNEYVTAVYYVVTCQKGERVGQMQAYFGPLFKALLNGKILLNSYVILDNVFFNINFYAVVFLREAGLRNSSFRYLLTDVTEILFAHLLSVWQRKTKTYL